MWITRTRNGAFAFMSLVLFLSAGCSRPSGLPPLPIASEPGSAATAVRAIREHRERVVYSFQGGNDGYAPNGPLSVVDGIFYGTTMYDGTGPCSSYFTMGCGAAFAFDSSKSVETVIQSFSDVQGHHGPAVPSSGLLSIQGLLYGTSTLGGDPHCGVHNTGCGTAFAIDPSRGTSRILYDFSSGGGDLGDPSWSRSALTYLNGRLYGTTTPGTTTPLCRAKCGFIYAIEVASGQTRILYHFKGGEDGYKPNGLVAVGGKLFGTTSLGGGVSGCQEGQGGCGTIFKFDPVSGRESIVYRFHPAPDGFYPLAAPIAVDDVLYGTTFSGGTGYGTVYEMNVRTDKLRTLYRFPYEGPMGRLPVAALTAFNGKLYGVTTEGGSPHCGGPYGCGAVFSLDQKSGSSESLHVFPGFPDAQDPSSALVEFNGLLYGTTSYGGAAQCTCGTIYAVTP